MPNKPFPPQAAFSQQQRSKLGHMHSHRLSYGVKDYIAKGSQEKIGKSMSKNAHKIGCFILETIFITSIYI